MRMTLTAVRTLLAPAGACSQWGGYFTAAPADDDGDIPLNLPRRVRTVKFTPSGDRLGVSPLASRANISVLAGKPRRYLIGSEAAGVGRDEAVTEVSCRAPVDQRGPGWEKNLREQFERRRKQGFEYVELDNPDAYSIKDVLGAIDLAAGYGLKVIAKNPGLMRSGALDYVAHPNVYGIIVERGAGGAADMDVLRRKAGKADLPVWFVAFGSGRGWANGVATKAKSYPNMGVTYSSAGEYGNAIDILAPGQS
jgi:hypothetical protein